MRDKKDAAGGPARQRKLPAFVAGLVGALCYSIVVLSVEKLASFGIILLAIKRLALAGPLEFQALLVNLVVDAVKAITLSKMTAFQDYLAFNQSLKKSGHFPNWYRARTAGSAVILSLSAAGLVWNIWFIFAYALQYTPADFPDLQSGANGNRNAEAFLLYIQSVLIIRVAWTVAEFTLVILAIVIPDSLVPDAMSLFSGLEWYAAQKKDAANMELIEFLASEESAV